MRLMRLLGGALAAVALVSAPALANPQKDGEAIASSLRNIGFETVTLAADATREKLLDALRILPTKPRSRTGRWCIMPATALR